MHKLASLLLVLLIPMLNPKTVPAQDFTGQFRVASVAGPMLLTLSQESDGYTGTLVTGDMTFVANGTTFIDEEDGDFYIDGTLRGPQGGGDFLFYESDAGDGYILFITPHDASGNPRLDMAAEFTAVLVDADANEDISDDASVRAADPTFDEPQTVMVGGQHDARLVGFWTTQVVMNSQVGSVASLLRMEFRPDGVMIDHGARAMGSFPDAGIDTGYDGAGESAYWKTDGDRVFASMDGVTWAFLARFEVDATRLFLVYYDGDRKLWHRQGQ